MSSKKLGWRIAQTVGAAILFKDYVAEVAVCTGESMLPTIRDSGDMVLVEKVSLSLGSLSRGDVVVCASPFDSNRLICKRIIGLV